MGFKVGSGLTDVGYVALVDVTPDPPPPPDPVLPSPPDTPAPTETIRDANIEQTGADPPPEDGEASSALPVARRPVASRSLPCPTSRSRLLSHSDAAEAPLGGDR